MSFSVFALAGIFAKRVFLLKNQARRDLDPNGSATQLLPIAGKR